MIFFSNYSDIVHKLICGVSLTYMYFKCSKDTNTSDCETLFKQYFIYK